MGVARQMIDIETRMLAAIKLLQPCSIHEIRSSLGDFPQDAVELCKKRMAARGQIFNNGTSSKGQWALSIPELKKQIKPKSEKKAPTPLPNVTPGRLISKMAGDYVPPKSFIRSDGLDFKDRMSLHAGIRSHYTGHPLTLGVRAK